MREVIYHTDADEEFYESARFYEKRSKGLGWRFVRAVQEADLRIAELPLSFPIVEGVVRKCVLDDFPFTILFAADDDLVFVLAVAHQHRRPGYWRRRLRSRNKR